MINCSFTITFSNPIYPDALWRGRIEFSCILSRYPSPKLTWSIPINQMVHYDLMGMDNVSLGEQETENKAASFSCSYLENPGIN